MSDTDPSTRSSADQRGGIFQYWPNRITALRFVGALVLFVLFAIVGDAPRAADIRPYIFLAFCLFVIVAATDFLDGYLARRDGHVSAFGRIADPFVDKVLVVGTMVYLAVMPWSRDLLPATVVVIILAREFLVTAIRGYVESVGLEFPADWFGKLKMIAQCVTIGAVLFVHMVEWPESLLSVWRVLTHVLVYTTLLATLGSGISYALKTHGLLSGRER